MHAGTNLLLDAENQNANLLLDVENQNATLLPDEENQNANLNIACLFCLVNLLVCDVCAPRRCAHQGQQGKRSGVAAAQGRGPRP